MNFAATQLLPIGSKSIRAAISFLINRKSGARVQTPWANWGRQDELRSVHTITAVFIVFYRRWTLLPREQLSTRGQIKKKVELVWFVVDEQMIGAGTARAGDNG